MSIDYDIDFVVYGNPLALKRHRSFRRGNFIVNYDPSANDKETFLDKAIKNKPDVPFSVPLRVDIVFVFLRPNSHYYTGKRSSIVREDAPVFHIKKPDVDNLTKFIFDSLNKVYWRDDSIIADLHVKKIYSEDTPRVEIKISRI